MHDRFKNGPHLSTCFSAAYFIVPDPQLETRYPEDPFSAFIHGGSSHLLNLDFLNVPGVWHNDKQLLFLGKVEKVSPSVSIALWYWTIKMAATESIATWNHIAMVTHIGDMKTISFISGVRAYWLLLALEYGSVCNWGSVRISWETYLKKNIFLTIIGHCLYIKAFYLYPLCSTNKNISLIDEL